MRQIRYGRRLVLLLFFLGISAGRNASGQCILANPSFEMPGSGGAVFGGWNQFGPVGFTSEAPHGSRAARVTGPNTGNWDVSGYWQSLDTAPGEQWSATVSGWHRATRPLTGQCRAILNIEWRGAGGNLISYESHTVVDPSAPVEEIRHFSVVSGPAPTGAVAARILLGVLQGPTDPPPDVYFDEATFDKVGPPSLDDLQWNDFPGGRTLDFRSRTWRIKGPGYYGPGPNLFCDTSNCTWVDADGRLHVTVKKNGSSWYSSEVVLEEALGYGDYIFTTLGRLDMLDPRIVLGFFLWQYGPCYDPANGWWNPFNEVDVEFGRWGDPANDLGQFVAQPFDYPGNISRFAASFSAGEFTSHAFRWLPDRVEYRSWRGGPGDETPASRIHSWTYTGPHIPRLEQPRVHINLWSMSGAPSTNQEVIIDQFTFVPDGTVSAVDETAPPGRTAALLPARPNPFSSRTTIRFTMRDAGRSEIAVYDLSGRLVRRLLARSLPAGDHEVTWDGRLASGNRVPSGVYLVQFRSGNSVETQRLVRLR